MGWPVSHSRSPALHDFWLDENGIDGAYVPLPVRPEHLEQALRALPALGFRGCNLTIPHKQAALAIVDRVEPLARRIGAVNTIIVAPDGSLEGAQHRCVRVSREPARAVPGLDARGGPAVVLGAGGCGARRRRGADRCAASPRSASSTARWRAPSGWRAILPRRRPGSRSIPWSDVDAAQRDAGLLVNTTSLGMTGEPPLELDLSPLPPRAVSSTSSMCRSKRRSLAAARRRGHPDVDGLGMLLHQGRPGFEAWFGARCG